MMPTADVTELHTSIEPFCAWLDLPLSAVMIRDPVTVDVTESLRAVQARMSRTGAGHLPVLDHGRPVGLVTARDVARSLPVPLTILRRSEIERLLAMPVTRVMSAPAIVLSARSTVEQAVNKMVEHNVGAVCVIDPEGGGLVGIITRSTIARLIAGSTRRGA